MNSKFSFIGKLTKATDWNGIVSEALDSLESLTGDVLFEAERDLIRYLGLSEFLGYDGRLSDLLLQTTPENPDYPQGRTRFYSLLLDMVEEQIHTGGPTLFLSTTRMNAKPGSNLNQDIVVLRNEIFEASPAVWDGYEYDLRPLWLSSSGYAVLSSYGASTWVGPKDFLRIQIAFMKPDLQVKQVDGTSVDYGYQPHIPYAPFCMSKEMMHYILKTVKRGCPLSRGDIFWIDKYCPGSLMNSEK
ncbi:MAG: hypothetical protein ACFFD6_07205 [Candidatus Thorarchaeota archaeon]